MEGISVIIPMYNAKKYLGKCMDSICGQDFADIQVICVDDASSDGSYELLEQYHNQDSRIELYRNDGNKGLAYTRNKGMKYANKKYIMFVDSDDYLAADSFSVLYNEMEKCQADFAVFDVQEFSDEGILSVGGYDKRIRKNVYGMMAGISLFGRLVQNHEMFGSVWDGIYRKEFLDKKGIRFIDGILHEDIPFTFSAFIYADRAVCINHKVYFYRQRMDSILHKPDYGKLLEGLLLGYADMLLKWHDFRYHNSHAGQYEDYVFQYMDSLVRMMEGRYKRCHAQLQGINKGLVKNFTDHFEFSVKKSLLRFFNEEDLWNMQSRKCVSIYGAGAMAQEIVPDLLKYGIEIDWIYVTDTAQNEKTISRVPIISSQGLPLRDGQHCLVLVVSRKNQGEIRDLLRKKEYKGTVIQVRTT